MAEARGQLTINGDARKGADRGTFKGILEIAIAVTGQAKELAPVDTALLKGSIMYRVGDEMGGRTEGQAITDVKPRGKLDGFVGSATEYAVYQEFGTRRMKPQPYLRPAVAIAVKGQSAAFVMAKIAREEMLGALREGQTRVRF